MNVRVFYQQSSLEKSPSVKENTEVLNVKKELEGLKKELELTKNEQDKINLKRKIVRLEKFGDIQEGTISSEKKEEVQSILAGKNTETYLGSDLHMLRKRGVDIASLTLVRESNPSEAANSSDIKDKDVFIVNFGGNESLARKIGAGDILPPEVTKVKINGVECERHNTPRPGYYNEKGKYQPIYDGYKIEIVERKISITPEETKLAEDAAEKRWKRIRTNDMEENNKIVLTELQEDTILKAEIENRDKERVIKRERFSQYSPKNREVFMNTFGETIRQESSKYGIPENILVDNLFAKENGKFNPSLKNPYSSAHGLGQIIDGTWRFIEGTLLGEDLDRLNPEDQIKATCAYLNYLKEFKGCSWGEAVVYYHTGPGFNDSDVNLALSKNPPIASLLTNTESPTANDYIAAAKKYYGIESV